MKFTRHSRILISALFLLVVLLAVLKPVVRSVDFERQSSLVEQTDLKDSCDEVLDSDENEENEQDKLFVQYFEVCYNEKVGGIESPIGSLRLRNPLGLEFPPELV